MYIDINTHNYCPAGRGICDCTNDMCMCTEVGEVSGRLYTGDRCECNPDVCYNADYPNVCTHLMDRM